jgi:hypothetical protein
VQSSQVEREQKCSFSCINIIAPNKRAVMKNPNRFYTYAYLREDRTPYYIGKGEGNRAYVKHQKGISVPKDKSRIIFLKQNLIEEEAFKHEKYMIAVFGRKDLGTGILRNLTNGGEGSSGAIRTDEWKKNIRKADEIRRKNQTGIYSITPEKRREIALYCLENNLGIHGISDEQRRELGRKSGGYCKENGLGLFAETKEDRSKRTTQTNYQKWMCLETGFVTNAGNLSRYQMRRGIDKSRRVRIE